MRSRWPRLAFPILVGLATHRVISAAAAQETTVPTLKEPQRPWIGVHMIAPGPELLPLLKRGITEALAPMGVNALIFEVDYRFQFQSHPELAIENAWSKAQARELAACCRQNGIRLIPLFNCLGHQSWAKTTFPLLIKYPELDETPQIPKDNPDIYCRSWCPTNPRTNEVVFPLLDELVDAFQADALHVGMDEVFLIASEQCPRCKGKDPAELFARAVTDLHHHLVDQKKLTMLMWGDRLLDANATGYGRWEASDNGTARAIDMIPKDIVLCDWHYEPLYDYPSLPLFLRRGFRVWPSSWRDRAAAQAFIASEKRYTGERMVGHLFTVWSSADRFLNALLRQGTPPVNPGEAEETAATLRACIESVGGKLPPP